MIGLVAVACAGWALAALVALRASRRRALVADAEHELRGAAAAIGLAAERMARDGSTAAFAWLVRLQLDRMAGALADLAGAGGGAGGESAGAELDAGRLGQVLGNLLANAAEHGVGPLEVRTSRRGGQLRLELRNGERPREPAGPPHVSRAGRGRGLAIAERAARDLGGRLSVESEDGVTEAVLELPVDRAA